VRVNNGDEFMSEMLTREGMREQHSIRAL
jgi:hypothetical protein